MNVKTSLCSCAHRDHVKYDNSVISAEAPKYQSSAFCPPGENITNIFAQNIF